MKTHRTSLGSVHTDFSVEFGEPFPTRVQSWSGSRSSATGSFYGFVFRGPCELTNSRGVFSLTSGMYFSVPDGLALEGGAGVLIQSHHANPLFQIGGPIEDTGRLRYIDGCTDTLLISPPTLGEPCLNLLHIPPNTEQTRHTHPSLRAGIIAEGHGICREPDRDIPLKPGTIFCIPADGPHSFHTLSESLKVIAYHPDSDTGPSHNDHPMINRTMVEGISATKIHTIHTRTSI